MSRLESSSRVVQPAVPEVREVSYTLTMSADERLLLARFAYCMTGCERPLNGMLKCLYADLNHEDLGVKDADLTSTFGWVRGTSEPEHQRELSALRSASEESKRITEGQRQRIEDLVADNVRLREEVGQQANALSRFQMQAPVSEDDHVEAPRKWKVQYACTEDHLWRDYSDGKPSKSANNLTRSAAYRWMRERNQDRIVGGFPRRVVPQDTPEGIEPDRGYYRVEMLVLGLWNTAWNRREVNGKLYDLGSKFATSEAASKALRLVGSEGVNYRVKWHSNKSNA